MIRKSVIGPTLVVGVFYAVLLFGLLGIARHDPRDFIEIGRRYIERSHASQVIAVDPRYHGYLAGDGYDGQFYYFMALDPANARYYIDAPVYRYERVLYPLLAWVLAAGQAPLIPLTLILINWLAATGGTLAIAARLRSAGLTAWWAAVFGLAPGMYFALRRDLADGLAYAFVALGIYLFYRGGQQRLGSALAFALAVLTRETTAVFPIIFALVQLVPSRRSPSPFGGGSWWGIARYLAISLVPWLVYRTAITIWLQGQGSSTAAFEPLPFAGVLAYWPWSHRVAAEVISLVVPALIVLAMGAWALWRRQWAPEILALVLNVLLFVVFLSRASYVELAASARISLGVVVASICSLPLLARVMPRARLGLGLAALLWLTPLPFVVVPALGRAVGIN